MPLLENEKLIKGYLLSIRDKYPNLTYDKLETILKSAFNYIKSQIEKPEMPTVLIKYFGKFIIFPGKLRTLLKENDTKLHFNNITPEQHQRKKEVLEAKLKEIEEDEHEDTEEELN